MGTPNTAYLGVDVGTSGSKVALIADDGRLLASGEAPYAVSTPQPGHAETDPSTWTAAVDAALTQIAPDLARVEVRGIGFSGQMHGAALCDDDGLPVAPAILWPDRRATAELERWRQLPPEALKRLANPLTPGMTGPMVAWLAEHRPELVSRASVVLHAKDVIRSAVVDDPVQIRTPANETTTGANIGTTTIGSTTDSRRLSDRSDASATLLWDVPGERWATDVCDAVGVPTRLLPTVVHSSAVVGTTNWLARVVAGASRDVPVVAGAGDTPAALYAIAPSGLQINFGTGAQVLAHIPAATNPGAHASTHIYADADDGWYAMAALQNGGLALEWAANVLGMTWDQLINAAAADFRSPTTSAHMTPPISGGAGGSSVGSGPAGSSSFNDSAGTVTFLPFLSGERGGVASTSSRGGWLGLDPGTTRDDLARAAVEGVVFAIRRSVELLGDAVTIAASQGEPVTLSGGGWRSPAQCRLMADVLGRPVQRVDVRSASATGAAMLAARGVGVDLQPRRAYDPVIEASPHPGLAAAYERWLSRCAAEL